jgi:Domain of Unknown Function (DUF1080)
MRKLLSGTAALFALLLVSVMALAQAPSADYKPVVKNGWEILFDGKNMDAWDYDASTGAWGIDSEGALYVVKGGPHVFTKKRYCDFILELDYKIAGGKKSNSGVFIHAHDKHDEVNTGMEIQILDNADYGVGWDAMNANGALYDLVHPSVDANKPLGEWNHYKITVNGSNISIISNGKEIVKADLSKWTTPMQNPDGHHNKFPHAIAALPQEGFIGLQNYGGVPVWFKNIKLKPLSKRQPKYTGTEPIDSVLSPSR